MRTPFIDFVKYLIVPTIINLVVTALIVIKLYGIKNEVLQQTSERKYINNTRDAVVASALLVAVIASLVANDLMALLRLPHVEHRGFIPFIIAAGATSWSRTLETS
jgi:Na+/H+ antiporter NhaD/arsenite permease-like protein